MIELLTNLYFKTTNPETKFKELLSVDVLLSILFHTISYLILVKMFSFIFKLKISNNAYLRLSIFLILIMILGYIGRLYRSKKIYKYYLNYYDKDNANLFTKQLINQGYFKFYFLG